MKLFKIGLAAAVLAGWAAAAHADDIRMLRTWDDRYPGTTVICDRYAELVTEKSGGEISFSMFGPESVPPLAQIDPVRNGIFPVLCSYPNFHTGSTTLLAGLESAIPDGAEKLRSSGAWDIVADAYGELGLKTLAIPMGHGITVFLTKPLSETGDIQGRTIRALPSVHPLIEAIGGSGVVLPPAEIFSALERGIVDGAVFPLAGAIGMGFAEVTSYYIGDLPSSLPHVILMNQKFWDGLSDKDKETFLSAGKALEDEMNQVYDDLNAQQMKQLAEKGVELQQLSDAAEEKYVAAQRESAWTFAHTHGGDSVDRLRQVAADAGLLR